MRTLITLLRSQIVNRKLSIVNTIMDVNNVKSQMRKGMLEYCIMLLLHKEPAYASDIIQKLKEARLIVVEGTLYPLLTRLKNDDLLGYEWIESTQGPPRKYYRLTEKEKSFSVNWKCPGKS